MEHLMRIQVLYQFYFLTAFFQFALDDKIAETLVYSNRRVYAIIASVRYEELQKQL
jgi:hypothetical protein